jgi:hypothetical protein
MADGSTMENHCSLHMKLDMEVSLKLSMEVMQGHTILVDVMRRHTILVWKRRMATKMIEFLICLLVCTTQNRKVMDRTLSLLI